MSVVLVWQQALCTQYGSVVLQNIVEVNRSASLVTDLRDPSRQRLRGVIQLSTVEELGKAIPRASFPKVFLLAICSLL